MNSRIAALALALIGILSLGGAADVQTGTATTTRPVVLINFTSAPDDVFALATALHMAEDAKALNRRVIVHFSQAGARVPMKTLAPELRFINETRTVPQRLVDLQDCGVEIMVCGYSAHMLGIHNAEFMTDTLITESNKLLLKLIANGAVVFTY